MPSNMLLSCCDAAERASRPPSGFFHVEQDATGKECGLHSGNVAQSATEEAKAEATDLWTGGAVEALSKDQLAKLKEGPRDKDTLLVLYAPWCQYSQVRCALACPSQVVGAVRVARGAKCRAHSSRPPGLAGYLCAVGFNDELTAYSAH